MYHESKFSGAAFIGRAILPLQQILATTQTISRRVRIGDAGEVRLHLAYSKVETVCFHQHNVLLQQDRMLSEISCDGFSKHYKICLTIKHFAHAWFCWTTFDLGVRLTEFKAGCFAGSSGTRHAAWASYGKRNFQLGKPAKPWSESKHAELWGQSLQIPEKACITGEA